MMKVLWLRREALQCAGDVSSLTNPLVLAAALFFVSRRSAKFLMLRERRAGEGASAQVRAASGMPLKACCLATTLLSYVVVLSCLCRVGRLVLSLVNLQLRFSFHFPDFILDRTCISDLKQ